MDHFTSQEHSQSTLELNIHAIAFFANSQHISWLTIKEQRLYLCLFVFLTKFHYIKWCKHSKALVLRSISTSYDLILLEVLLMFPIDSKFVYPQMTKKATTFDSWNLYKTRAFPQFMLCHLKRRSFFFLLLLWVAFPLFEWWVLVFCFREVLFVSVLIPSKCLLEFQRIWIKLASFLLIEVGNFVFTQKN